MPGPGPTDDLDREQVKRQIVEALDRRRRRRTGDNPRPVRALALARAFGIRRHGSDDSRKRGLRGLVAELRQEGVPIVSTTAGYWLAEEPGDHAVYHAALRRMGLAHLVEVARDRRSDSSADASGQLTLF